jgi:hypothetical protein
VRGIYHGPTEPSPAYLQVFRHGAFERIDASLGQLPPGVGPEHVDVIAPIFEQRLVKGLEDVIALTQFLQVDPPLVVFATLLGFGGSYVSTGDPLADLSDRFPIRQEIVNLPDVLVEDFDADLPTALRPLMDALWQAGSWWESRSFDADGNWKYKE